MTLLEELEDENKLHADQNYRDAMQDAISFIRAFADKLEGEEMIEKVARAICRAGICGPKAHLNEQENTHWRRWTIEAKAALAVVREMVGK